VRGVGGRRPAIRGRAPGPAPEEWRQDDGHCARAAGRLQALPGGPPRHGRPARRSAEERELLATALSLYRQLAPLQRSCVVLEDVLSCSLEEIAEALGAPLPAIKGLPTDLPVDGDEAARVSPFVVRFNARDWAEVRQMLAADVRLELVARGVRLGSGQAGHCSRFVSAPSDDVPYVNHGRRGVQLQPVR